MRVLRFVPMGRTISGLDAPWPSCRRKERSMTHTNHREGTLKSLMGDSVVLMMARKESTIVMWHELQKFFRLSLDHRPDKRRVFSGRHCTLFRLDTLIEGVGNAKPPMHKWFLTAKKRFPALSMTSNRAGLSVADKWTPCRDCRYMQTECAPAPHGPIFPGRVEKDPVLPDPKISEMTTMCGHQYDIR